MTTGLNTWGLVLYNNTLLLFPLELLIMGELKKIKDYMIYFESSSQEKSYRTVLVTYFTISFFKAKVEQYGIEN